MGTKKFTLNVGKLILLSFVLSLLFLGNKVIAQSSLNRLVNPGFEDGFASGWSNWMSDNNVIETDPANVHGGLKAISLHPVNWSGSGFGQSITTGFSAGETYMYSGYGKVTGITSGHISMQLKDADGNKTNLNSPDFAKTGDFNMQVLFFTVPDGTIEMIPNVWYDNNDGSVLIVDDLSLVLQTPNLLLNPGFEDGFASGWANWMPDNNIVETDPANVHGGLKAVSLHPVNWSGSGFGQSLKTGFIAGEPCTFSGYGKVTGTTSGHISLQCKDADGIKTNLDSPDFANTGSFEMLSFTTVIPVGTVEIVPNVWYDNNDGSVLIVDDLSFTTSYKVPVITNNLRGTGFEYKPAFVNVTGGGAMPDTTNGIILDCDGTGATDVTSNIQAALNEAVAAGKPLLIPYTSGFYKISGTLDVKTSVMGIGGMPTIKQVGISNTGVQTFLLADDMTGWIYNLHVIGPYDGSSTIWDAQFGYIVSLRGVNGVTVMNNLFENPQGDHVADDGGAHKPIRNVLITNNTLLNAFRCGISASGVCDRWAIFNNYITYHAQFVNPIDFEPYQESSLVTNMEIGYNNVFSPEPAWEDDAHWYETILKVTGYFDQTPGGNIFSHHNWGDWGVPWTNPTGYQNGPSNWINVESLANIEGTTVPGTNPALPTTPADLIATAVDKTAVALTWTASTAGAGVKGYLVYKDGILLGTTATASYDLVGLDCAKAYSMVVKAYDTEGNVSNTAAVVARPVDCSGGLNKIINPGIEEPLSVGWTADWGNNSVDTTSHNGMHSLHIDGEGGRAQSVSLTADNSYTLSAWGRLSGLGPQAAYFGVQFQNAANEKTSLTVDITDTTWHQYFLSFTVPTDAISTIVYQYVEGRGDLVNYALTDDWSLVPAIPVTAITISKTLAILPVGIVQPLTATIEPMSATNPIVTWSSSDAAVASVSINGLVQGKKIGIATITATTQDGEFMANCEVTVNPPTNNLLKNPGIEQALSVGWTGDWGNNSVVTTDFHSGTKCLAIGPADGGRTQLLNTLVPGSTYTVSTWGKLSGEGFGNSQKHYIGVDIRDKANVRIALPTALITDSAWVQVSLTFTLPMEAASANFYVYRESAGNTTNMVLTDDWSLISGWDALPFSGVNISQREKSNMKMYPNPLKGSSLNLEGIEGAEKISLFDMTGRLIYTQSLRGSNQETITLKYRIQKGSYMVKISGRTGVKSQLLLVE